MKILIFLLYWHIIIIATDVISVEQTVWTVGRTTKLNSGSVSLSDEEYVHSGGYISELITGCISAVTRIDFMSNKKYD